MANGALTAIDPKPILAQYLAGQTTAQIAASLGVTRQGLDWHLRTTAEEQWRDAQIILALERKHQADEELDNAPDVLSLARAREKLRSAQWDLERTYKRVYGTEPTAQALSQINVTIDLGNGHERTVVQGRVIDDAQE